MDSELNREVALKEIQPQFADDPQSRGRFMLEAELTGRLEHPGVIPVYGLGADEHGRPYYAMRFVRGDSLKQAIDRFHAADRSPGRDRSERTLALRGLLGRFASVCQAIAYAHSRGVIHRDIKPANVMLGPYGETLVVDWGLAKVIGREDPAARSEATLRPSGGLGTSGTHAGSALGTPAYMSPEQSEGRLEAIGPASDVYSLGATLYCMLTSRPPIEEAGVGEMLQSVQRGEYPKPRTVNASVPVGLEAIALKAMALKPSDRYPSAESLAEDVEHWLADEPVTACTEPMITRLARWGRRHRTAVGAVLSLLVAAVVALSAGTVLLGRANARTQRERDLAVKNFQLARQAVDDYLTQVGQSPLLKDQGLHELREQLLGAALRYYQDFLDQRGDDPTLRLDAAKAHDRVGVIASELGKPKEAYVAYEKGLVLIESLERERPGDQGVATERIRLLADRLLAMRDGDKLQQAADSIPLILADESRLLEGRLEGDEMYAALARYCGNAALTGRQAGGSDGGVPAALRAVALGESRTRAHPEDLESVRTLLMSYAVAAQNLWLAGRLDEASLYGKRASEFADAQVQSRPRDVEIRMAQAWLNQVLCNLAKGRGRPAEACDLLARTLTAIEVVISEHPRLVKPRITQTNVLQMLSQVQTDLGRFEEAEKSARRTILLAETLSREVPTNSYIRLTVGYGHAALGKALRNRSAKAGEAIEALRFAIKLFESTSDGTDMFNAACSLSIVSTIDDPADGAAGAARRGRDADHAVATLQRAFKLGFAEHEALMIDPDLAAIRSREDFQAVVRQMRAKSNAESKNKPPH